MPIQFMAIFADQEVPAIAIVATIAFIIVLGVIALFFLRGYEKLARRSLRRKYLGLTIYDVPQPGRAVLNYHSYHGFIAWITQTPQYVTLPPNDARKLLGRLLRFNLVWGLFTYGTLLVLPFSIINYFAQRRSIAAQESTNCPADRSSPVAE